MICHSKRECEPRCREDRVKDRPTYPREFSVVAESGITCFSHTWGVADDLAESHLNAAVCVRVDVGVRAYPCGGN